MRGLAHAWNQFAPVFDGVFQRIEAANQERRHAQVPVVEQRFGDLLGGTDERRRVAAGAGQRCNLGPQALVANLAAGGGLEQSLRADVLRRLTCDSKNRRAPLDAAGLERGQDTLRTRPGLGFVAAEDRAHRQAEPDLMLAPETRGGSPNLGDGFASLIECFAPKCIDVRVAPSDGDRLVGRATEVHWQVRCLSRLHRREAIFDLIKWTRVVERNLTRPGLFEQVEVIVGTCIARRLVQKISIARLLMLRAAGDDVHGESPVDELIERRELTGRESGRDEAWAMCEQELQTLGLLARVRGDLKPIRGRAEVANQHSVEPGILVRARKGADEGLVDDRAAFARAVLGAALRADGAYELERHGRSLG